MHTKAVLVALLAPAVVSAQLNDLAVRAGLKYFGTAVREGSTSSDAAYMAIINNKSEFGSVVPENGQKWDSTEPSRGSFSYTKGDITTNIAKKNAQLLRCHTLVWYSQLPSWVSSATWTRANLQAVIEAHVTNVMGHYLGQCYAWDVLNEAVNDDGAWRDSIFLRTFGTDYFAIAFAAAKKADPVSKLYYNDYNLEYNGAKTTKAFELVQMVQAAGAPIDGVGFQGHLIVGGTPSRSNLAATLRRFTALGVEVAYTELDIRHSSLPASAAALATQGNDFANVVGSCLDVAGCVGATVWSYTDKYSWVPETFSGAGDALLYDKNLVKKVAWTSVSSVLAVAATGAPATTLSTSTRSMVTTVAPVSTTIKMSAPAAKSTASSGGAEAPHWGQCGGIRWEGAIKCQSPWHKDAPSLLGGLVLTAGVTNANFYAMVDIIIDISPPGPFFLQDENGETIAQDAQPFLPGRYFVVADGTIQDGYKIICFQPDNDDIAGTFLDARLLNDPQRPFGTLLRWRFRQAVLTNMKGAGEPNLEHDFPPGSDMMGEIRSGPKAAERMEFELFNRLANHMLAGVDADEEDKYDGNVSDEG
ncbi:glycoside hydrolase superfamily [Lasiosphaeris hirsuta]|uniref:Beta-xylanase n=1 Tax=Lasiosphaeris hirsuta TaxID=260670 RepID=A0AA40AY26_9PEZI|nr:glycoside hydrolase superfamily [Lasiosphaeris hirsuta]